LLGLSVFLRTVEHQVMEQRIPVEEVAVGDVLGEPVDLETDRQDPAESLSDRAIDMVNAIVPVSVLRTGDAGPGRIAGLTAEQVEELQETQDTVTVRTGVRFIPSFPAAILLLLLVGDPVYLAVQTVL
ncbi:MAG: hypothetical protein SVW77_01260, partial [Candidatus Nanohaloarchaea archaeon]|nr:hypothetical protein [Candidatus Nanohaloarchaea archaeon]